MNIMLVSVTNARGRRLARAKRLARTGEDHLAPVLRSPTVRDVDRASRASWPRSEWETLPPWAICLCADFVPHQIFLRFRSWFRF